MHYPFYVNDVIDMCKSKKLNLKKCLWQFENPNLAGHMLNCHKCLVCRGRIAQQWIFRLNQEKKRHDMEYARFVTLTYSEDKVPISGDSMTLYRRDLTLFLKRYRKALKTAKFDLEVKYFACGEYGSRTHRPHYHLIMFGCVESIVRKAWGNGHCHFGKVQNATVGYVVGYMEKTQHVPAFKDDPREKEFRQMSIHLGENYIQNPEVWQYHFDNPDQNYLVSMSVNGDPIKIPMPEYYSRKIFVRLEDQERRRQAIEKSVKAFDEQQYNTWLSDERSKRMRLRDLQALYYDNLFEKKEHYLKNKRAKV